MALHACPDCDKLISTAASACPQCGCRLRAGRRREFSLGLLVLGLCAAAVLAWVIYAIDESLRSAMRHTVAATSVPRCDANQASAVVRRFMGCDPTP